MTEPTPLGFESDREVHHRYDFDPKTTKIVFAYGDPDVHIAGLYIKASRTLSSTDQDIDTSYVDITVRGRGYHITKSGALAKTSHTFYLSLTDQEANEWVMKLVRKARNEVAQ